MLRRGVWTVSEVKRLKLVVGIYVRGHWKEVGSYLPGRSLNSIIGRYEAVDHPGLKRLPHVWPIARKQRAVAWTVEEDNALLSAMERFGAGNWCATRRVMLGRTTEECWRRFQQLNPNGRADMYDALLTTMRLMLPASIGHMKGQKSGGSKRHRSELAASDFQIRLMEVPAVQYRKSSDAENGSGTDSRYDMLTTGDDELDRGLVRVNRRRRQNSRKRIFCGEVCKACRAGTDGQRR